MGLLNGSGGDSLALLTTNMENFVAGGFHFSSISLRSWGLIGCLELGFATLVSSNCKSPPPHWSNKIRDPSFCSLGASCASTSSPKLARNFPSSKGIASGSKGCGFEKGIGDKFGLDTCASSNGLILFLRSSSFFSSWQVLEFFSSFSSSSTLTCLLSWEVDVGNTVASKLSCHLPCKISLSSSMPKPLQSFLTCLATVDGSSSSRNKFPSISETMVDHFGLGKSLLVFSLR